MSSNRHNPFSKNTSHFEQNIRFNTNTAHPLIQSSQEYMYYNKFVSIHSEDRDVLKYPSSSEFEIEMPQDMLNVAAIRLTRWNFPANYNSFSVLNGNVTMTFQINAPYNPNINGLSDILLQKVFECLFTTQYTDYNILIEDGFYNPPQMATELTNKMNYVVTVRLLNYFTEKSLSPTDDYAKAITLLNAAGGYTNFLVVYNSISQNIWFGNICDGFLLTNETQVANDSNNLTTTRCTNKNELPDYSNWGLPGNLGLPRTNVQSVNGSSFQKSPEIIDSSATYTVYDGNVVPRFYYGDVTPGDSGFWLLPSKYLPNSQVNWVECTYKINLFGPAYMYMEIAGQNCIDETSPYNVSTFTLNTNETNGVVNSAFAKIPIPTTPIALWFDNDDDMPYKYYYPPAERIRRLKIKLRYHNGQLVNFGILNYSFLLEFLLQTPQILRNSNSVSLPNM